MGLAAWKAWRSTYSDSKLLTQLSKSLWDCYRRESIAAMLRVLTFVTVMTSLTANAQGLSQQQACEKFSNSIVSIDAGGISRGTGFIVSPDGFMLTASHVVRDDSGTYYSAIEVTLPTGEHLQAIPALPLSIDNVGKDYALLKITANHPLSFLQLGNTSEVNIGADATIIGFPFSAISANGNFVSTKFCLAATFAAVSYEVNPVGGTRKVGNRMVPFNDDVHVDVIYFQGPSVKGISGSPIISRDTAHVVGIVSTKLTGIGPALDQVRKRISEAQQSGGQVLIMGVNTNVAIGGVIDTLDTQLANGLGSAVGVEEAARDLSKAQHQKR